MGVNIAHLYILSGVPLADICSLFVVFYCLFTIHEKKDKQMSENEFGWHGFYSKQCDAAHKHGSFCYYTKYLNRPVLVTHLFKKKQDHVAYLAQYPDLVYVGFVTN